MTSAVDKAGHSDLRQRAQHSLTGSRRRWAKVWSSLQLDATTILQMLKGGLPPVIVLSIYQATSVAKIEFTVGYLAVILTVSAQCLLPRAKFTKIMFFSALSTCCAAAISCIAVLCSVRARQQTSSVRPNTSENDDDYNSSASAVCAIWLVLCIWISNALRAHRPIELQDPMVAFSIFSVVALTHAPSFLTIDEGLVFVRRLLETFLIGLAVATAVSLLILPMTSRKAVYKALRAYPGAISEFFDAQVALVQQSRMSMRPESDQLPDAATQETSNARNQNSIASTYAALQNLQSKVDAELAYTRIEVAWGQLSFNDFEVIHRHLRLLDLSLAGLAMLPQILDQSVEPRNLALHSASGTEEGTEKTIPGDSWDALMVDLEKRLTSTGSLTKTALSASFDALKIPAGRHNIMRQRRHSPDVEKQLSSQAQDSCEASVSFHADFRRYKLRRSKMHTIWPSLVSFGSIAEHDTGGTEGPTQTQEILEQVRMFSCVEHIQTEIVQAANDLLEFAEYKASDGSLQSKKVVHPPFRRLRSSMLLFQSRRSADNTQQPAVPAQTPFDAEHLPPNNFIERAGDRLRLISRTLTSTESVFGFRVALASSTIALLAFLRQTQDFFNAQRLIWAMIVVVIGMKPESGASVFGYIARILGTVFAVVLSFLVWYIPDGNTAGVLICLYIANALEYYFWVRFPQLLGPVTISIVTFNVIVGYELQVRKLGTERATSNGQPYYPLYLFGPYKLLCVLAGVTISFFWTIFPSPVSPRSKLRKRLGRGLFLLANLYSHMHTSVKLWIQGEQGHINDVSSPGSKADSACRALYVEQMMLLTQAHSSLKWTTYDLSPGGKFPRAIYQSAISKMQTVATCLALMACATSGPDFASSHEMNDPPTSSNVQAPEESWIHHLAAAAHSPEFNSHATTSLLCHLAGAVSNNTPLPPYLPAPAPYVLTRKLLQDNAAATHLENIRYSEFSAFACMETMTALASAELEGLVEEVKKLVGEINLTWKSSKSE